MEIVISQIFSAVHSLVIAGIIVFAYFTAVETTKGGNFETVLWKGLLICGAIAWAASSMLGDPSCITSEYDTMGSVCTEYADNAYTPTTYEMIGEFAYFMTLLYLPVLLGAYHGKDE